VAAHILKDAETRAQDADSVRDVGPQVAVVVHALTLAGV